ncbi:MAG: rhomboid family intramembrane serine protease [Saprospiraceae bacterium]
MLQSIWEDVKREFSYGNMVTRVIIVNVVVFILVNLINVLLKITGGWQPSSSFREIVEFFSLSSDGWFVLTHPWVIFTHMFLHVDFWHILWNMLYLYWFGRIVGDFIGNQRVMPIYLLGGLAGALLFFITANFLPYAPGKVTALGASGAVMAMVVAAGAIAPDYIVRLLFLGDVKLKYIVFVLVVLDLLALANNINTGGHFAHLGGAAMGWIFVRQLREGRDWALPVNAVLDRIYRPFQRQARPPRRPHMAYKNPNRPRTANRRATSSAPTAEELSHQDRLDLILDKIKQSGYDSLTEDEKEFLFNASKK